MRVYLGVAHVVDMMYGKASHENAPTPDLRATTVRKLKSLGVWGDVPSALQGALTTPWRDCVQRGC